MKRERYRLRSATLLAVTIAGVNVTMCVASVPPWADRARGIISQGWWQLTNTDPTNIHPGIDFPARDNAFNLTPIVESELCECNDSGSINDRYAILRSGSTYYEYLHIQQGSIFNLLGVNCATLDPNHPIGPIPVTQSVASAFDVGHDFHFAVFSNSPPWGSPGTGVYINPLRAYSDISGTWVVTNPNGGDVTFADNCPSDGVPVGTGWTVYVTQEMYSAPVPSTWSNSLSNDVVTVSPSRVQLNDTWTNGGGASGGSSDIARWDVFNLVHDGWVVWTDYYTNPAPLPSQINDFTVGLSFGIPSPFGATHQLHGQLWDQEQVDKGSTAICAGYVGIDRWVLDLAASGVTQGVRLTWTAGDFDPGMSFTIWRSVDGGVSYEAIDAVLYHEVPQEHEYVDYTLPYRVTPRYKLEDSEGGPGIPGPDPWWGPVTSSTHPSGLPAPPLPSGTPVLAVVGIGDGSVKLRVSSGVNWIDGYMFQDVTDGYSTLGDEPDPTYSMGGLPNGRETRFNCAGLNLSGLSVYSADVSAAALPPPGIVIRSSSGLNVLEASWGPVQEASGHRVRWAPEGSPSWSSRDFNSQADRTAIGGLFVNTRYCVTVESLDEWGNASLDAEVGCVETGEQVLPIADAEGESGQKRLERGILIEGNPVRTVAKLALHTMSRERVRVRICDAGGRVVRDIFDGPVESRAEVGWDLHDAHGHAVSAGVYFVEARGEGGPLGTRKLVVVRD